MDKIPTKLMMIDRASISCYWSRDMLNLFAQTDSVVVVPSVPVAGFGTRRG